MPETALTITYGWNVPAKAYSILSLQSFKHFLQTNYTEKNRRFIPLWILKQFFPLQKKGLVLNDRSGKPHCTSYKEKLHHWSLKVCKWLLPVRIFIVLVRYQYLTHFSGQTWIGWPWSCRWNRWGTPSPLLALSGSASWGSVNMALHQYHTTNS